MPVKRICSCGKSFQSFGSSKCLDCTRWNAYLCSHPQFAKYYEKNEIRFAFSSHPRDKDESTGEPRVAVTLIKGNDTEIWIFLYRFDVKSKTICEQLCQSLTHEWLHRVIIESSDALTSKKSERVLLRLEKEGYI